MPLRFERHDGKSGAFGGKDTLLSLPVLPANESAPVEPWLAIAERPEAIAAAVDHGARGILFSVRDDLLAAGELAVALAVAEAERDLPEGSLPLLLTVAGPGAVLALARGQALPSRVVALGIDLAAFPPGEAATTVAAGLVSLAAAALGLPSFLACPTNTEAAVTGKDFDAFAYRLADVADPPR